MTIKPLLKPKKGTSTNDKIKKLKKKLDRLYQEWGRREYLFCFLCGAGMSCLHHIVYKSQSLKLRWDKKNGLPICMKCHCRVHTQQKIIDDWKIEDTMSNRFGDDWKRYIKENERVIYKPGIKELEDLLKELTI